MEVEKLLVGWEEFKTGGCVDKLEPGNLPDVVIVFQILMPLLVLTG